MSNYDEIVAARESPLGHALAAVLDRLSLDYLPPSMYPELVGIMRDQLWVHNAQVTGCNLDSGE